MLASSYVALARYNRWMNEKLYASAAELSDEERRRDLGAFFGSLHSTLEHIVAADRIWLGRFTGEPERFGGAGGRKPSFPLVLPPYATFDEMRIDRVLLDDAIDAYVGGLTNESVEGTFSYKSMAGKPAAHPLWIAVTHVFNHQTHHRGQATSLLVQLGKDPGVTDFVAMMRALE